MIVIQGMKGVIAASSGCISLETCDFTNAAMRTGPLLTEHAIPPSALFPQEPVSCSREGSGWRESFFCRSALRRCKKRLIAIYITKFKNIGRGYRRLGRPPPSPPALHLLTVAGRPFFKPLRRRACSGRWGCPGPSRCGCSRGRPGRRVR